MAALHHNQLAAGPRVLLTTLRSLPALEVLRRLHNTPQQLSPQELHGFRMAVISSPSCQPGLGVLQAQEKPPDGRKALQDTSDIGVASLVQITTVTASDWE